MGYLYIFTQIGLLHIASQAIVIAMISALAAISTTPIHEGRPFDAMQESLMGLNRARASASNAGISLAQGDISAENAIAIPVAENAFNASAIAIRMEDSMNGALMEQLA